MTDDERIQRLEGQVTAMRDLIAAILSGIPQDNLNITLVRDDLEQCLTRRHITTKLPPATPFDDAYGKIIRHFLDSRRLRS